MYGVRMLRCVTTSLGIRRSAFDDSVFQTLVVLLVMLCLDYGKATLVKLTSQLCRLQSVLSAAARLTHRSSRQSKSYRYSGTFSLHRLRSPEHIDFKLHSCFCLPNQCGAATIFSESPTPIWSLTSSQLVRLSTVSERAFPVAGNRL